MIQKIANLFNSIEFLIKREKTQSNDILELQEQVDALEATLEKYREQLDYLEKSYSALTYIVESHNTLLVEMTGLSRPNTSPQSSGGLTKLPDIFSEQKHKKPN